MKVDLFDFDLPAENIAQQPARPRDSARLLHVPAGGDLNDLTVRDLPDLLRAGDVMVFNNTKVIPARLSGHRQRVGAPPPGPRIEVTLHKCFGDTTWQVFARPGRKLREGDVISFADDFDAQVTAKSDGGEVTLEFGGTRQGLRDNLIEHGIMPLPPYIRRGDKGDEHDDDDYQTVYADREGAVAAPTAGLHFTDELLGILDAKGVEQVFVTLHVGAGTFLPVKVDDTQDHKMHGEWGEITPETADVINRARAVGGRVVAVGTTALRLLESAVDDVGAIQPFSHETEIFITPGYSIRSADLLMTNFHLPRSTLFMLVSAFAGQSEMREAYDHAIAGGYRFYSYGDTSLLERLT
jgi:S-adenosylmethionine:tRNA ribosyltransferase-isomerase